MNVLYSLTFYLVKFNTLLYSTAFYSENCNWLQPITITPCLHTEVQSVCLLESLEALLLVNNIYCTCKDTSISKSPILPISIKKNIKRTASVSEIVHSSEWGHNYGSTIMCSCLCQRNSADTVMWGGTIIRVGIFIALVDSVRSPKDRIVYFSKPLF